MIGKISRSKLIRRFLRIIIWIFSGFIILSISLSLLLLIPSVQKIVVDKATNFLTTKTNMKVDVGSVHIGFPKTIKIGGVYIEDLEEDTLLYCQQISINADLIPLIHQKINIDNLQIKGLKGKVKRSASDSSFNFSPLIDAFSSKSPIEKKSTNHWQIGFDELTLDDIELSYNSFPDSTSISLVLGHLKIEDNASDIMDQDFDLKSIELEKTSLALKIGDNIDKSPTLNETKKALEIPISLRLSKLDIEDITFNLEFTSGKLGLSASLKEASVRPGILDLTSQKITLNELLANEIDVALNINAVENNEDTSSISPSLPSPIQDYTFGNFDWNFLVDHAEISNTNCLMDLNDQPRLAFGMDYMHMDFSNFNVVADSIFFNKDATGASVSALSVEEISGPKILEVTGIFAMNNQEITARNMEFRTQASSAKGSIKLSYPAMRLIGKEIQEFGIESDLEANIHVAEIKPFTSILDDFPTLKGVHNIQLRKFISDGVLGNFQIKTAEIAFGKSTFIRASGKIIGLPSSNLYLSYAIDTLITNRNDLYLLIPDSLLPINIALPQTIGLQSSGETDLIDAKTISNIMTEIGEMHMEANLSQGIFSSTLNLIDVNLGSILNDTTYGEVNLQTQINGELKDKTIKSFTSKTQMSSACFNGYTYSNGNVSIEWADNNFIFDANLADTSLSATINGNIYEKDSINHFTLFLDLENSNLQNLSLVDDFFTVSGNINIDMDIKSQDDFRGLITAANIQLEKSDNSFHIDALSFESDINENYTNFNFRSEIVDAALTGNTKLSEIKDAIIDHLDLYITLPDSIVSTKEFEFEFNMDLKNPALFTEFLIKDLEEIKLEKCFMKYNDKADILQADIIIPELNYNNLVFQGLSFIIDSEADKATTWLELNSLSYDSAIIHNLQLHAEFESEQAESSFTIYDFTDSLKYQLITQLYYKDSIYKMTIAPDKTIFNYDKWEVPESNYLQLVDGKFSTESTQMSNGDQKLILEAKDNIIQFGFDNFKLDNFSNILEYDGIVSIFNGKIFGFVQIIDPFAQPKINAEIDIPGFTLKDDYLGDLSLNYNRTSDDNFDIKLQNGNNYIKANGIKAKSTNNLSLILESNIKNASVFQPLTNNYVKNMDGGMIGRLSIAENNNDLIINGKFDIENLKVTIPQTNTQINQNGQILIENNIVGFQSYVIRDSLNNPFTIEGNIDLRKLNNPVYNLTLKTSDFLVINSKPAKGLDLYGKLKLAVDLSISGKQSKLKVASSFTINKETDIVYVMPGKELELITDEGIVSFVDLENESNLILEDVQNQFIGDSLVALIEGIDFTSSLQLDPAAKFTVVVDPNSGDITKFQINGKLFYRYNDTERGTLTGLVELREGYYDLSFYGLVKKRFNYDPGSTVSWSGDVMDGEINFAARHTVRTNSVGLVSNEISSNERAMYNQRLPYDVILKVNDKIKSPTIQFELDLPKQQRSSYPTLDSKLNILNQSSMESERNKQVFALLVGGTFIPENPDVSEGSSSDNFATTAARNSVNALMTQQLNKLTGQLIQGVDVDMGVNTFDDYSSGNAQTRTQLDVKISKNLFNDRVSAEMQSHIDLDGSVKQVGTQSTAGMMEFAVSYKLTETGNYRIKAFRENAYDIFDGEIQNSGIAFIFVREFDSFKNIRPPKVPDLADEKDDNN